MNKEFNIYAFLKKRPLSWSAYSSFKYSKEQWYERYILNKKSLETPEMKFGKLVGERLATDLTYLPGVPRLDTFEHPFNVMFGKIKMTGYADSFCKQTKKRLKEYKTGVKEWDAKRVNEHGQIDMYMLMHFITDKIKPEEMDCELVWIPTQRIVAGDFKVTIDLVDDIEKNISIFKTKRTMAQLLKFGATIKDAVNEMEQFVRSHA